MTHLKDHGPAGRVDRPTKILSVGLGRTGSYSMALALRTLGYRDVFHAVDFIDSPSTWRLLDRAANASFSSLPTHSGCPFSRAEWDELFGPCEAITDVAGPLAPPLIATYPEARVVLVHREFDAWWRSVETTLLPIMWGPMAEVFRVALEPLIGSCMVTTGRKLLLGWARARDLEDFKAKAREAFERHERDIVEVVPPTMLLHYRIGDGWEPLCQFLSKEVPAIPFPHANETAVMKKRLLDKQVRIVKDVSRMILPFLGIVALLLAATVWLSS